MASVTEAMGALEDKQLVNYRRRKDITLTPKAKAIVLELETRRNLLRYFAKDILLYPQNASEKFVEKIAHCIDDEFCERLSRHISRTKNKVL
jgi:Mn-dependent DtxR family transcriptional regulator